MAFCFGTCEILDMTVTKLGYAKQKPISVYEDNQTQSAIYFSKNNADNAKTNYIDVIYHFVREQLVAGLITILKIPTKSNTADILMKPLFAEAHWRHMSSLLVNIYPEGEGREH